MKPQDEIDQLQARLAALQSQQARCQHDFTPAEQKTKEVRETRYKNVPRGSDYFNPVPDGFDTKHVPIWVRCCKKCGLKQETDKAEQVVVKAETRPRF